MQADRFTHYILGDKILDEQHRDIYDALCAIRDAVDPSPEEINKLIQHAIDVCKFHFLQEDLLMQLRQYPFIESHRLVHQTAEQAFFDVLENYTPALIDELITMFLYHIDWFDRQFVAYITQFPHRRSTDAFNGISPHQ